METENKQDLLARDVVGAQIIFYWAYERLEVPEIMWVRTNNYRFHTFVRYTSTSASPRPSYRFSKGLVPRLSEVRVRTKCLDIIMLNYLDIY